MKYFFRIGILFLLIQSTANFKAPQAAAQSSIDFQVFYDELSPYGSWIDNPDYGYVWVPDVDYGFSPYHTNGYWVFTDEGWTWVSNYVWGWAPFHYGRWYNDIQYRPIWVPGYEWGPGWVTWRRSEGYYGWAPIGPGISIDFAYSSGYNRPYNDWTFIRDRDFGRPDINNYFININITNTIIQQSVVINNFQSDQRTHVRYNAGPERREVEQISGRSYTPVTLTASNERKQQINNRELRIYRPEVQQNNAPGKRNAPQRVTDVRNVKPARERTDNHSNAPANQPANPVRREQAPVREPATPRTNNDQRRPQPETNTPVWEPATPRTNNDQRRPQPETNTPVRNPQPVKVQTPRRDQPVEAPKRDFPVQTPRREQPVQNPKREQPVQTPPREQPVQSPRSHQPQQNPKRDQPQQSPARNQPIRQQENKPVVKEQQPQQSPPQKQNNKNRKKD